MKYDFETVLNRKGKDSKAFDVIPFEGVAPDEGFDPIPMWIADMSFPVSPAVTKAILKRMEMPNYGYFALPQEYFDTIISWQRRRNGVTGLEEKYIGYENGVLGGISSAVQAFSSPGEKILMHSPTYVGFTHVMEDTGRPVIHSELKRDENGIWRMDYEDMDAKLKAHNIHLAIFCSPHNPCGRVWERWEIEKAMEVYAANDCIVISDEIWSDIIMPGHRHIPTQTISEDAKNRVIAFYSASKTASLAGLVGSYHIIYNSLLRDRVAHRAEMSHYNDQNVLSVHSLIGAFSAEGEEWIDEMIQVVEKNFAYAVDFIAENFDGVECMKPEGTYMLYLDCGKWCQAHSVSITELQHRGVRCGVIWQDGEAFYRKDTIRMNLALPFSRLEEAMDRLKKYAFI